MRVRFNVWIEDEKGDAILTLWRIRLLEAIRETGSINAAAQKMGVQFRTAWNKIHEMEEGLGTKLVESQTGGAGGGGTTLTPEAETLVEHFHRLTEGLPELLEERFKTLFEHENAR